MSAFTDSLESLLAEQKKVEMVIAIRQAEPDLKGELLDSYGPEMCRDLAFEFFHCSDAELARTHEYLSDEIAEIMFVNVDISDLYKK